MSTATHTAFGLYAVGKPAHSLRSLLITAGQVWHALGEGFAAASLYQELTRQGFSHREAVSKVFLEHYSVN